MKNYSIKIASAIFLIVILSYSCKKEEDNEVLQTEEIAKVESYYHDGVQKVETPYQPGMQKIETSASDELKNEIRQKLEDIVSKRTTYLKSGSNLVGVIASGSCGSYSDFDIYMDTEDNGSNTSHSGWIGDCYANNGGPGVILRCCAVYNAYFEHISTKDFAVIDLSNVSLPNGVSEIIRYIDNEDDNNNNWLKINDVTQTRGSWWGQSWFGGDTRLGLYYYPKSDAVSAGLFPSLGISYGVFGRFGSNQGSIYSDDEDHNNANWCLLNRYNKLTDTYSQAQSGSIANIIDVGANTRFYISKVY